MDIKVSGALEIGAAVAMAVSSGARLIGIDGLPVAGKSTLADKIITMTGGAGIFLDDFVRPEAEWRGKLAPSFPFGYIRYDEFLQAVTDLARDGHCSYRPYDWASGQLSAGPRKVSLDHVVVIEGVSALHPRLRSFYDLGFWVESDGSSLLEAALGRGVGDWAEEWRTLFIPSVALYLQEFARSPADIIVKGRGYSQSP
jgi:uridine kinase